MSDAFSLLGLNKGVLQDFSLLAERVADHQTEKVVKKNVSKLKVIEERLFVDKGIEVAQQSIDAVISKVIHFTPTGDTSCKHWTVRELRIVSYYLMKLRDNTETYSFALKLLDKNWKNIFFNGLTFYLMNSWHNIEPYYREKTSQLLIKKLTEYTDNNRCYLLWKNHANLFEANGPIRMAALVAAKRIPIDDAPTILGFKKAAIKQSYFSDVIVKYVSNNNITERDTIENIFEIHKLDRTKKLLFAYLVEKEDQRGDGLRRAQLCRFANIELGDVTLASSWAPFVGATETDVLKLKKAMRLVNMWFAQQIIESFFEICVQDKERKTFWLNYVPYISGFKIIGSTAVKRLLQANSKIGSMFIRHFIETNSYSSQTSALALFIKNKMIVEFSDTGALYVYNQTHGKVKSVTKAQYGIASTNDLKIPSMNGLIELNAWGGYYYYEEGRMTHRGYWQQRLTGWMNQMVLSAQNSNISFMDNQDDDIFKAKPLPAENFKLRETQHHDTTPQEKAVMQHKKESPTQIQDFNFKQIIKSKTLEHGVCIVGNHNGFYLSLGKQHYAFLKSFKAGENPAGTIWFKQASLLEWKEIIHSYGGSLVRTIGFIRITANAVTFKENLSSAERTTFELL